MPDRKYCMICENSKNLLFVNKVYPKQGMSYTILDALFRCFNLQFLENHGKAVNRVCEKCFIKLQNCCAFRRDVEEAHRRHYMIIDHTDDLSTDIHGEIDVNCYDRNEDKNAKSFESGKQFQNCCNEQRNNWNQGTILCRKEYETIDSEIVCKKEFYNDAMFDFEEDANLSSQYDCCNRLDNTVDYNISDSPYNSDWSVDTDDILRATGYRKGMDKPKTKCISYKSDYNLCETCGKKFKQNQDFNEHIKSHSGVTLKCPECSKIFYAQRLLNYHIKTRHQGMTRHRCHKCKDRFSTSETMRTHLWKAHQKKAFSCLYCKDKFGLRCDVRQHIKDVHFEISKFKCITCDLVFVSGYDERKHMLVHTGVKNQQCEICNKSFIRIRTLKQHMKTHNKSTKKMDVGK